MSENLNHSAIAKYEARVLKEAASGKFYDHDMRSRWGNWYTDLVDQGRIHLGPVEEWMNGRYRCTRRAVYVSGSGGET